MLREFREFINRGNFVDLAVGFVMGVAVTGVVTAIVQRLIMPAIAVTLGQPNFDSIGEFACTAEGCAGSVGAVLTALVNFLVIAFVLFLIVRAYNRLQRADPTEPEPEADAEDIVLLREIRDALVRRDTP
ncbi:MAG TPA: large conductance mechanosensitive channel protein MscL [Egicoccus sp.]|nr:large conductance mechanosensitive channel protein MscL [Egicoccus sp.]HSK24667.1 large conductance mechanosensitive channel protein MscL [Egicoccus sp.]